MLVSDGADWLMLQHCREERGLNPQSGKAQGGRDGELMNLESAVW